MTIELVTTDGIFALDGGEWEVTNNIWLVGDDAEVVVFDAAHDHQPILDGINGRRVRAIVLTHGHNDHINAAVALRDTVRRVDLDTINFATGSAYVTESQVLLLGDVAGAMLDVIDWDPSAIFLIEGHTDAVGSELYNLDLSDRRAESVARILTDYYDVPPENLVMQGYGEQYLKVATSGPSWENRRATIRNISPLLETASR